MSIETFLIRKTIAERLNRVAKKNQVPVNDFGVAIYITNHENKEVAFGKFVLGKAIGPITYADFMGMMVATIDQKNEGPTKIYELLEEKQTQHQSNKVWGMICRKPDSNVWVDIYDAQKVIESLLLSSFFKDDEN